MGESQRQADPKLCWSCGKQGSCLSGSRMHCSGCDVTWMPRSSSIADLDETWWNGMLIKCIDFTEPGALNCPA
jgi:hypothetical protein